MRNFRINAFCLWATIVFLLSTGATHAGADNDILLEKQKSLYQYLNWVVTQNLNPWCDPTKNYSGVIDTVLVFENNLLPFSQSTHPSARQYQILRKTPVFTPFVFEDKGSGNELGDCYLSAAMVQREIANLERMIWLSK